jgi:PadR family transcriptional regulator/virulence activator alpha
MLELAILGLLKELPLHGYELKKRLNDSLGDVLGASYGSLYPALARLEKLGAIEAVDPAPAPQATIPATGSISGEAAAARLRRLARPSRRTRKAYRIAARGDALFAELLQADPAPGADEDRAFALKLAFCRYLEPAARLELLQRRRAQLAERLARGREAIATRAARGRVRDRYAQALIEHGTRSTERDLEWVDELIDDELQEGSKV